MSGAPTLARLNVSTAAIWTVTIVLLFTVRSELREEAQKLETKFGVKQHFKQLVSRV